MESINIEELFDKEITKSRTTLIGDTPEAIADIAKDTALVNELVAKTLRQLETASNGSIVFHALSSIIRKQGFSDGWAGEVFDTVAYEIRTRYGNKSHLLPELKRAGIEYFKTKFNIIPYEKIPNDHLLEIIQQIKKEIKGMDSHEIKEFDVDSERFKLAALEEVRDELEDELAERKALTQQTKEVETEQEEKGKGFSMRQKVLALMLLTFRRLERPEDIKQERVVEFFHKFTGGDFSELRIFVSKPTAYKKENNQSIKYLCDDLNTVRNYLEKLGLGGNVQPAINKINLLIKGGVKPDKHQKQLK